MRRLTISWKYLYNLPIVYTPQYCRSIFSVVCRFVGKLFDNDYLFIQFTFFCEVSFVIANILYLTYICKKKPKYLIFVVLQKV